MFPALSSPDDDLQEVDDDLSDHAEIDRPLLDFGVITCNPKDEDAERETAGHRGEKAQRNGDKAISQGGRELTRSGEVLDVPSKAVVTGLCGYHGMNITNDLLFALVLIRVGRNKAISLTSASSIKASSRKSRLKTLSLTPNRARTTMVEILMRTQSVRTNAGPWLVSVS